MLQILYGTAGDRDVIQNGRQVGAILDFTTAASGSISYFFFFTEKRWKAPMYIKKIAWPQATYDVISQSTSSPDED